MESISLNFVAIIVATVVGQAIGFTWFGPLFGKRWAKLALGKSPEQMKEMQKKGMAPSTMALSALSTLVMAYVLAWSIAVSSMVFTDVTPVQMGFQAGFWNWLGFMAPILLGTVLWHGKPWKLFVIEGSHWLVVLCAMALVLTHWF